MTSDTFRKAFKSIESYTTVVPDYAEPAIVLKSLGGMACLLKY